MRPVSISRRIAALTDRFRRPPPIVCQQRTPRGLLLDRAVAPLLIAGLWLGIGCDLWHNHQAARQEAARQGADRASAAAASVAQAIALIDQTLLTLRADYATAPSDGPAGFDLTRWSSARFGAPASFRLDLVAADGDVVQSSQPQAPALTVPPMAFAPDEDRLLAAADPAAAPFSLRFARRLVDGDGRSAGLAVLSIDPRWLWHPYGMVGDGRGLFLLAGPDGAVLARTPAAAVALGAEVAPLARRAEGAGRPAGTLMDVALQDGITRIVSFRSLPAAHLLLAVGEEQAPALAADRAMAIDRLMVGVALSLVILLGALMVLRRRRWLLAAQQDLRAAIENVSQGIVLTDASGRISLVNRRAIELCRLEPRAAQAPEPPFGGEETIHERHGADGSVLEVWTRQLPGGGAVSTLTDITERRRVEEDFRLLAHHDPLTGLANRHKLRNEMAAALADQRRGGVPVAVIFLDLDRFKAVNDTHGHAAGDQVLREVADRLRASTTDSDVIARLGGDEFVVMQSGARQPASSMALARRLVDRVSEPFDIAGHTVSVGTSIGIAIPAPGETMDRLLSNADVALYAAKAAGRGTVRMFDTAMGAQLNIQRELVQDLRGAIEGDRIEVHYQPIFTTATGEIAGFEAVARWNHDTLGAIPSAQFVALAEANGLIHELGRSVLMQACAAAASWPDRIRLVVNLSPDQIGFGNLAKLVGDELRRTGLRPGRLELEVSERALIEKTDQALAVFRGLRGLGVKVSLDGFGSGYSSLAYLRLFQFDRIKIDPGFVRILDTDTGSGTVVQAILGMGRTMQIAVAADGVENEMQLAILRQQRCSEVQGDWLSRPGPADGLARFLVGDRPPRPVQEQRVLERQAS